MRQVAAWLTAVALGLAACGPSTAVPVADRAGAVKTTASERALRRAYDGAPPVMPHEGFSRACLGCHNAVGVGVDGVGYAPPSPHGETPGLQGGRCGQCHVPQVRVAVWRANGFAGVRQDLRRGDRLYAGAPPTIPHRVFMREDCAACHTGPAAREEVRMRHEIRGRCRQCHVPVMTRDSFGRGLPVGP